jgi:hypothetical protein
LGGIALIGRSPCTVCKAVTEADYIVAAQDDRIIAAACCNQAAGEKKNKNIKTESLISHQ